jgi:hypothetical protein
LPGLLDAIEGPLSLDGESSSQQALQQDGGFGVLHALHDDELFSATLENAPRIAIEVCHFIPKATKASKVGSGLSIIACFFNIFPGAAFGTGV